MGTHASSHTVNASVKGSTLLERTTRQVRQLICRLSGHDTIFRFDDRHVSLICVNCGYESPGWQVPGAGATRSANTRHQPLPKRAA